VEEELREILLYLEWDDSKLVMEITAEDIEYEFARGSLPYLLLTRLERQGNNEALQLAYQLIREVRE